MPCIHLWRAAGGEAREDLETPWNLGKCMPRDADGMACNAETPTHSISYLARGPRRGSLARAICCTWSPAALLVPLIERYRAKMDSFSSVELSAVPCLELHSSLHRFSKLPWRKGRCSPANMFVAMAMVVSIGCSGGCRHEHRWDITRHRLSSLGLPWLGHESSMGALTPGNCRSQSREPT